MKIQKFNENLLFDTWYLVIDHDNYDLYYGFTTNKNACDFIISKLYSYFRDNKKILNELDDIENSEDVNYDLESISEYYNEFANHYNFINKISTEEVIIMNKFEFSSWIQARRNAKKYNL